MSPYFNARCDEVVSVVISRLWHTCVNSSWSPAMIEQAILCEGGRTMSAEASQLTQGIAALSQPFRLNLARAPHEKELSDYGSNTVLIEPLATMAAVEDFLYPKLRHTNSSNKDNLETAAILDTILTGVRPLTHSSSLNYDLTTHHPILYEDQVMLKLLLLKIFRVSFVSNSSICAPLPKPLPFASIFKMYLSRLF